MAKLIQKGYGQVEPNHLSGQATKQLYAALPADEKLEMVENGMFLVYDMAAGKMTTDGEGEPMLVFSEVKLYHPWESYKDFVLTKGKSVDGKIYPRLVKTNVGDHYTTNCVEIGETAPASLAVGNLYTVDTATGYLTLTADAAGASMVWKCVKVYTLADNQKAVKLQRVK